MYTRLKPYLFSIAAGLAVLLPASTSAAEKAAEVFRGRGYTVQTDKEDHLVSLKATGKVEPFHNADFELLKDETKLASLELSGDFTAAGVARLADKKTIERLVLGSPNLTDQASVTIATLAGLKSLELYGNLTSEWGKPLEGKLPNLQALTVNGRDPGKKGFNFPRDTSAAFQCLPSFPSLTAFNPGLHHIYYINNEVIETFGRCPKLQVLKMGGSTWGGDKTTVDYSSLLACKQLNTFVQFHADIYHDPTCKILAQLPEMKDVVLDFVTDDGVKELAKLPKLASLRLGASLVGPEGIQALAKCRSLRRLEISDNNSYAILDELKAMKQLTGLTWTSCIGGAEAESELKAALPNTKVVLTDRNGERATAEGLQAAWEKSLLRIKRSKQLEPFVKAAETYRKTYPLSAE